MPEEIAAALNRIAATLSPVDWCPPEDIRRRAQARQRRTITVGVLAAVLLLAGGAGVVQVTGLMVTSKPSSTGTPAWRCPDGLVAANIELPEFRGIRVNVFNSTQVEGLAAKIGEELRIRSLQVVTVGNDPLGEGTDGVALIRYGPPTVGAAWVMRSFFLDQATLEFDLERQVDTVDIVLGNGFEQLATPAEVNRTIAMLGRAQAPPGTCAGG